MELTQSFLDLLAHFVPVFTEPTFRTFTQIGSGWILSHRHRYITDVIFSGGNVANGHWARFHRFFSDAAWDLDVLNMYLALEARMRVKALASIRTKRPRNKK